MKNSYFPAPADSQSLCRVNRIISPPTPRVRWRRLALNGLLVLMGLGVLSALIEHSIERRVAARLTAGETFATLHGRRIRYHLTGRGTPGPTIVLLTGGAASLEQWDAVQTALSTVSPVVSYDRGGFGFSDPADAHDACANADELDQLLHSLRIAGPVVLVSYSSSSMMAIVFAARHRDLVKGMVFLDPTLRSPVPGTKTYRRIYWHYTMASPLEAFFGYTRLTRAIAAGNAPPPSPASERWNAVINSTNHWLATAHDAMNLDESADEADAVMMTTRSFTGLPLGVLTTAGSPENFELQRQLAASSARGFQRPVHGSHSEILNDPVAVASVINMIRTVADEVRAPRHEQRIAMKCVTPAPPGRNRSRPCETHFSSYEPADCVITRMASV